MSSCTETAVSFIYLPKPPLPTVEHPQYLQRLEVFMKKPSLVTKTLFFYVALYSKNRPF